MLHYLLIYLVFLCDRINAQVPAIRGTQCSQNQVITKLTVYEDGAIEAECNKIPCGAGSLQCMENQTSCRADRYTFSGMKWAPNGQSVLLRCCPFDVPKKVYVGTDLVSLGSYYTGGDVEANDRYDKNGIEFDFVANIRTEQGGVRVWVFRALCSSIQNNEQQKHFADGRSFAFEKRRQYLLRHLNDDSEQGLNNVQEQNDNNDADTIRSNPLTPKPFNPLQYRPRNYQRDQPIAMDETYERLIK